MAKSQIEKTLTSLVGEFSVAGQLCLQGYLACFTLKNYPGVDILCTNPKNHKCTTVQVKTIRNENKYFVPKRFPRKSPVFVFVHINKKAELEYFVVPARKVEEISIKRRNRYLREHPGTNEER